jgi:hypothetical protein
MVMAYTICVWKSFMYQITGNKQKQLTSHTVAALFMRSWLPAGMTRICVVRVHMAGIKEAAP